jgi:hypothetical protein
MSRGPGHVQRTILAMIEAEPHGAWTTDEIARRAYPGTIDKKHRVAVLRALFNAKLPDTWWVGYTGVAGQGRACVLYDSCDDQSQARREHIGCSWRRRYPDFDAWKKSISHRYDAALEMAATRRKVRDASPVEKIDLEVKGHRDMLRLLAGAPGAATDRKQLSERIATLTAERARLLAEQGPIAA